MYRLEKDYFQRCNRIKFPNIWCLCPSTGHPWPLRVVPPAGLSVVECCGTTKFRIVNSPRKRVIWSETRFDQRPLPRSTVHPVQSRSSAPSLDWLAALTLSETLTIKCIRVRKIWSPVLTELSMQWNCYCLSEQCNDVTKQDKKLNVEKKRILCIETSLNERMRSTAHPGTPGTPTPRTTVPVSLWWQIRKQICCIIFF